MDFRKTFFDYDDWQPHGLCNVGVAVIGSSLVGAASTAFAANKAAGAQTAAAQAANASTMAMYKKTRKDLAPYREFGNASAAELQQRLPFLTSPIVMDQAALEQTPGYQFTKRQGLKAVQNSSAARGLGVSGAALKGAATFATGLADQTYQTQFNLENINRTNAYDRLKGIVDTGENAAAQTGVMGSKAADTISRNTVGAGNAQAAGINAAGGAARGFASDVGGWMAYRGLSGGEAPGNADNSYNWNQFNPIDAAA